MKINSILLMLSLVACGACTDFLEESDPSNFTQENYFQSAEQARSIVNAIYADFRYAADNDYGGNPYLMTDFMTGLSGTRVGQNAAGQIFTRRAHRVDDPLSFAPVFGRVRLRAVRRGLWV